MRAGLFTLLLLPMLCACTTREGAQAEEYWNSLRSHSLRLSQQFLAAAAQGDTAQLREIASEKVVNSVLGMQPSYRASEFAAAASPEGREMSATVLGYGTLVQFAYNHEGQRRTGIVEVGYDHKKLLVVDFSLMANVD